MEKLALLYVLIPAIFAYMTYEYRFTWLKLLRKAATLDNEKREIVIGVLSSRDHFLHRQTIRKTWQGYVKANATMSQRVDIKFVVGRSACEIPILDRTDPYTCETYKLSVPEKVDEVLAVREVEAQGRSGGKWNYGLQTTTFKVHHPVVLSKLGIHADSLQHKLAVRLLDASTQAEIVSTVFTKDTPGVLLEGFRYKAVEPYLLPKVRPISDSRG